MIELPYCAMHEFLAAALGWPTLIFSVLLAALLVYWLLAIIGWVDLGESLDMDMGGGDAGAEISLIASYAVAFGLSGVPFSIVVTLLVVMGWLLSTLAGIWLLPLVPALPFHIAHIAAGAAVLLAAGALSIVVTARLVRPLRGLFATRYATQSADLVGQSCRILTGVVDERLGRAEVAPPGAGGAGINIRVRAAAPNTLRRGSRALIVEYDAATHRYLVQVEAD